MEAEKLEDDDEEKYDPELRNTSLQTELIERDSVSQSAFNIEFIDIGFTLKNGVEIMKNVSGQFTAGRMCAIMGPSGAGKTTVINLVTGKALKTEGKVLINGKEDELAAYKKLLGFVPQEDVMIRTLTVRNNIAHSAKMRLPKDFTKDQTDKKVAHTLVELGISHVQHSIIGDERERGVSGGQRKRVNIAIELVADPVVLFLDEPTSGLDSTTSTALCKTLKRIARNRQMTVAAVIHQVNYIKCISCIFESCLNMMMISHPSPPSSSLMICCYWGKGGEWFTTDPLAMLPNTSPNRGSSCQTTPTRQTSTWMSPLGRWREWTTPSLSGQSCLTFGWNMRERRGNQCKLQA